MKSNKTVKGLAVVIFFAMASDPKATMKYKAWRYLYLFAVNLGFKPVCFSVRALDIY